MIYTSSLRITVQRKVPIAKILGAHTTQLKLYDQIGARGSNYWKIMYAVKVKNMSVYL